MIYKMDLYVFKCKLLMITNPSEMELKL